MAMSDWKYDLHMANLAAWALRYALPRQTVAGDDVRNTIREMMRRRSLFVSYATGMADDIDEAIARNRCGDPVIDGPAWLQFADELRAYSKGPTDGE